MKNIRVLSIALLTLLATNSAQINACCPIHYSEDEAQIAADATLDAAKIGIDIVEDATILAERATRSKKQEIADRRARALAEQQRIATEAAKRKNKNEQEAKCLSEQESASVLKQNTIKNG